MLQSDPNPIVEKLEQIGAEMARHVSLSSRVLESLDAEHVDLNRHKRWDIRTRIKSISFGFVAAAVILAVGLSLFLTGNSKLLAQVSERIMKASSYSVDVDTVLLRAGKSNVVSSGKWYWRAPDELRKEERTQDDQVLKIVKIVSKSKPGMEIDFSNQQYARLSARQGTDSPLFQLQKFGEHLENASKELGSKKIGDVLCKGFEIDLHKIDPDGMAGRMELWVDTHTQLPAKLSMQMGSEGEMEIQMENFVWNQELENNLFSTEVPAGFRNVTPPTYPLDMQLEHVASALRLYTEWNDGKYPQVSVVQAHIAMGTLLDKAGDALLSPDSPDYRRIQDSALGWHFISEIMRNNPQAAYYGKTVGPKDHDKVLLSWKLEDGTHQRIFGDLRIEPPVVKSGATNPQVAAKKQEALAQPSKATDHDTAYNDFDLPQMELKLQQLSQDLLPSVVSVCDGSGVIISAEGLVLSQWHVTHEIEDGVARVRGKNEFPSLSAGTEVSVTLYDGRQCKAELLGANQTLDLSLLKITDQGPYPFAPLAIQNAIKAGNWMVKIGHPLGLQQNRTPPVRLGRVLWGDDKMFTTDCLTTGGDSGGPYFSLEGQLMGIACRGGSVYTAMMNDVFYRRNGGFPVSATGVEVISGILDSMKSGTIAPYSQKEIEVTELAFKETVQLPVPAYTQGTDTLTKFRSVVGNANASVVEILNEGVSIGFGTIVDSNGLIVAKASDLPPKPMCRLPGGRVVSVNIEGVDPTSDLAFMSVDQKGLAAIAWTDITDPKIGTLLAVVGTTDTPVAIGNVSVARRQVDNPKQFIKSYPVRVPAGHTNFICYPQTEKNTSLLGRIGLSQTKRLKIGQACGVAWAAGLRNGDILLSMDKVQIETDKDIDKALSTKLSGDVVDVQIQRNEKVLHVKLPLCPQPRFCDDSSYRQGGFHTFIESSAPAACFECGAPALNLSGKAIGIVIARRLYGSIIIPADVIQLQIADVRSGKLAKNWTAAISK